MQKHVKTCKPSDCRTWLVEVLVILVNANDTNDTKGSQCEFKSTFCL